MIVKILKGVLLGVIANFIGTYLYVFFFAPYSFESMIRIALEEGIMGKLIALGAVMNLLLFFFLLTSKIGKFQKKIQPYEARGVLMATILAAFAVLYFEFF